MSNPGVSKKRTIENIKKFWEEAGQVTTRDQYFRFHELRTLIPLIPQGSRLLDVGCGTGDGTEVLLPVCREVVGVDYSMPMILEAQKLATENLTFVLGDLMNLALKPPHFDVITGQRVLINIPNHSEQMIALSNLRKYVKKGAALFLTEATEQGHKRTDEYRKRFLLPPLAKYWHNKYVDESKFLEWHDAGWKVKSRLFFDTYMLLSKAIYPAACGPENCKFLSGANHAAMDIANIFRCSEAILEIGIANLVEMYVKRVQFYDKSEGDLIEKFVKKHHSFFPQFDQLGHQHLIMAEAI